MTEASRFRDAARVHVDAPADRVRELLSDPDVLQALDDRLTERDLEILTTEDRVEVSGDDGHLHFAFRVIPEDDGTRIAAMEDVEPRSLLERTKWMLFPQQAHDDLENEMDRLRHLVEAFDAKSGG